MLTHKILVLVTVKYNDYNSRIVINPIGFATAGGVNTSTNTIHYPNHGFETGGDKIIHTAIQLHLRIRK